MRQILALVLMGLATAILCADQAANTVEVKGPHICCKQCVRVVGDILAKLGLKRAACRFPDWQTLDHLVQLVQLPDASSAH